MTKRGYQPKVYRTITIEQAVLLKKKSKALCSVIEHAKEIGVKNIRVYQMHDEKKLTIVQLENSSALFVVDLTPDKVEKFLS